MGSVWVSDRRLITARFCLAVGDEVQARARDPDGCDEKPHARVAERLAGLEPDRFRDLRDDGWIQAVRAGPAGITYRASLAACFEPRITALSDHAPITQGLVASGVGVSLVSSLSMPQARKDIVIRPLKPAGPERDVFAVSLPGRLRPPAITAMVEILGELAPRYERGRKSAAVRPSSVAAS